tara:strand:- start:978 stop:1940 length:963 start_codon:yes stop_codon:yes gene_type:complete
MKKPIYSFICMLFLLSCSSISSIESPDSTSTSGLGYYLPKKDFLVRIEVENSIITEIDLATTTAYPDQSEQYVLKHSRNYFGKNTLDVSVTEDGLLTSSKSTTVSNVNQAFTNLATSAGQLSAFESGQNLIEVSNCSANGEYTFIYPGPGTYSPCGVNVTIKKLSSAAKVRGHSNDQNKEYSGIYYRQNEPYMITAVDGRGLNISQIVMSPSASKTFFLPVSRSFFANNEADFNFINGVPTKFRQDMDGEIVAFFKLPSDVIGAYFGAIGSVFEKIKLNDANEAASLNSSLLLELAKVKYSACINAIDNKDADLVKELGC